MMNKQILILGGGASGLAAAVIASATLIGAGAFLVWNSRQAKMIRAAKRASKILYKAGTILQSVAEVAD